MTWFTATSVTIANGQTVVSVNTGDDIELAQESGGLIIGSNPPVEIKRTYLDGQGAKKIELRSAWGYASQTAQAAVAFPTDGDLAAATAVLKGLIEGFTIANKVEAELATDNTKLMTPLRVKESIDYQVTTKLATQAEAEAGTNNTKLMTPLRSKQQLTVNATAYLKTADVVQVEGQATNKVMSQKSVSDSLDGVRLLLDNATPFASTVWDVTSDVTSAAGISNGVTKIHVAMRRCLLLDNGTVNYYLDANNSALKADGTASVLTGAGGQVMVEIPKCYVKAGNIGGGSSPIVEWSLSADPKFGYVIHPAFVQDGNLVYNSSLAMWNYENVTKINDYIYVGAYQASVYDTSALTYIDGLNSDNNTARVDLAADKLASVSGKYPMVGLTRAEFRTLAGLRGTGWQQYDFWTHSLLQLLYTVEYRNLNSQAAIGAGNTAVASGYPTASNVQTDSPHSVAGKSNAIGNGTGAVASTLRDVAWMSYRGVENFWGNCWVSCDGVNILDRNYYVKTSSPFVDNTATSYTQLGVTAPAVSGYIRDVQANTISAIPSSITGGSSTIAFSDQYYQTTGWVTMRAGGGALLGEYAGAFLLYGNDASGGRYRLVGGRLVYKKVL